MKRLIALLIALMMVFTLAACGGGNGGGGDTTDPPTPDVHPIVGTWECLDDTQPHLWLCFLVFDEDGRFVDKDGDAGDYIIDGNSLTLEFDAFLPFDFNFSISGDQLTITGDGIRVVLTRQ